MLNEVMKGSITSVKGNLKHFLDVFVSLPIFP